jgi:hypothetical protein
MYARVKRLFIVNSGQADFAASACDMLPVTVKDELKVIAPALIPVESEPTRENPPPNAKIVVSQGQGARILALRPCAIERCH